ncbi:MAG: RNA 3'-terminal phosphate cyclase [Candidatus ainarchaeum sp.]|nr:RNA 3'-terminal phosphate cyclase [Candidatus ainarchaeum sp.]
MIEIDGSHGEGGGQIVRTALTLSALTNTPVRIFNIRAKRDKPGLRPQHLMAAKAVRSVARGTLEGAEENSHELSYTPSGIIGGKYEFNIGTAGSSILVAQTVLPLLLSASKPSEVKITGGTHNPKAPSYDYFDRVFLPALNSMGCSVEAEMLRAGYYPSGGGEIRLKVKPSKPKPTDYWTRVPFPQTQAIISLANLPMLIAVREKKIFVHNNINRVYVREEKCNDKGNSILAYRGFVGFQVMGEKGKPSEKVGEECFNGIRDEGDVDVDHRLADQLLIYAFLAGKTTYKTSRISSHTATSINITGKFLHRGFSIEGTTIKVE